jgi:hypothetical protein
MNPYSTHRNLVPRSKLSLCLGAATVAVLGQTAGFGQDARLEKLEKENLDLRKRLDAIESVAQKEGILQSGQAPKFVASMSEVTLSGFVQASYFYNTRTPVDGKSDGYLWNTTDNSFSINKVKITLASKPVERSGEKWDAGFRTSLMFGEDAGVLNTGGETQGLESLREAYVDLNVPVGTGLNIKAGQLISLLNYESGDGGAANANFSQGYQWFFTGNGPSAGVQAGYTFTDWFDVKARVQNGLYAGAIDNNDAKTVMLSLGFKPDDKTWVNVIGFGGDESATTTVRGGSLLAGRSFGSNITTGLEFDYFNFDTPTSDADLWSIGGWFGYDFTPKVGVAIRGEYLSDPDGGGLLGIPFRGDSNTKLVSTDSDGDIASVAFTLNLKPVPNIKIQPEVRFDTTSYKGAFDGKENRVVVGIGASYLF